MVLKVKPALQTWIVSWHHFVQQVFFSYLPMYFLLWYLKFHIFPWQFKTRKKTNFLLGHDGGVKKTEKRLIQDISTSNEIPILSQYAVNTQDGTYNGKSEVLNFRVWGCLPIFPDQLHVLWLISIGWWRTLEDFFKASFICTIHCC